MKTLTKACLALLLLLYFLPLRVDVVPPYQAPPVVKLAPTSEQCLATALWYEARGESLEGQRAVLDVILNRKAHSKKPVCEVIAAPKQFSWWRGKWKPYTKEMKRLLKRVKSHPTILKDKNFRWFYSKDRPWWAKKMECVMIGNQTFCRGTS